MPSLMVARFTEPSPDSIEAPSGHDPSPAFSRYDHPVDRREAGAENAPGGVAFVPLILHRSYLPKRKLTREQRREAEVKQAALRILCGLETRSLRSLARDVGCCHQAIDKMVLQIAARIGVRKVRVSEATRARMRAARMRSIEAARPVGATQSIEAGVD